ncbi:AzlC family ABC transporter permease [Streptococcus downei]|uniref:Branched-chain amino acid transporter protein n=1 Tax=Streptococcus downei MFe28 TaxID=764290 RepID=A0A380JCY2_STRDO|nr:AzlC family ABC transporter permease [Streptococcus downei]EFQ57048.1 putative azaleucine resistance protein AzlC [Streptococcus downei F0415]SUN35659.1 branched-chain amino acid transporter protein [Streptococcus downei MFe28]
MQEKGFREGLSDALPTALGYISIGIAFGVVASSAGLSAIEVGLMSLLIYGGSAQFAMVAMLVSGADLLTITLTVFLINLRNMLMSLHATTIFTKTPFFQNLLMASLITDESYGVLLGEHVHHKSITAAWMHGNNVIGYLAWFLSTVVGTLMGKLIPDPQVLGLDFALIAMFLGLLIFQFTAMISEGIRKLCLILLAVAISYLLLTMVLSSSLAVLLSTLIGCSLGVILDGQH